MADQGSTTTQAAAEGKGKSKVENPPEEVSMDDDDSSDEESGVEEVCTVQHNFLFPLIQNIFELMSFLM